MRMSKMSAAAVCMAILVLSAAFTASFADERTDDASIVGTWLATTTVNVPGAPPFVFSELAAFNAGGTVVDTHAVAHSSDNPFLPGEVAVDSSDAFGTWRRQNDHQFVVTFKRLLFAGVNTPTSIYGPFIPGQHVGFETVQAVFTVQPGPDGGTLTGSFTVQFAKLSGQVVFAASGTVSAKRVKIEPLVAP